jgi:hypothetical protein
MSELGSIKFFQACLPSLLPGDYTVTVDQTVQEVRPEKPFRTELEFSVAGPRFSLNPAGVYSVYPPANQSGAFGDTLPHIILTRRTLPWERTMDGSDPDEKKPCPWLALLVLSPSDFSPAPLPKVEARKVEELLKPGKGIKGPDLAREADLKQYESVNDLCNTIDIPKALFASIVPAEADLPYLAHVREVDTVDKETASLKTEGCFSVVIANRFPETTTAGIGNMAVLVSLEGFQNHLHGKTGTITEETVRLAVLANWSFLCQGKNTFKTLVDNLDPQLLKLPQPAVNTGKEGMDEVIKAYELGYTALTHRIRNGEPTVSWYRGPLVPLFYRKPEVYRYLPCADAALRYNYNTGFLDVTYAAAWQLGRLLALQNSHFGQSMYRCRNQERQKTKSQIEKQAGNKKYGLSGTDKDMDQHLMEEIGSNPDAFK